MHIDITFSVFIASLIYIISGIIALLANESLYNTGKYALHFFTPIITFLIIINWVKDNKFIEIILTLMFIIAVLLSLYVEYIFIIGDVNAYSTPIQTNTTTVALDGGAKYKDDFIRHTIPGITTKPFAGMLMPLILYGILLIKNSRVGHKIVYLTSSFLLSFTLFMTLTRAALLTLFLGIIVLSIYKFIRFKQLIWLLAIVVIISVLNNHNMIIRILSTFTAFDFISNLSFMQDIDRSVAMGKLLYRFEEITKTLSLFINSPIFGSGPIAHSLVATENYYFRILAMIGLVGFIPLVVLLFYIFNTFRIIFNKIRQSSSVNSDIGIILFAGLICNIFYLLFAASTYYFPWIWFALSVAWVRNAYYAQNNKKVLGSI